MGIFSRKQRAADGTAAPTTRTSRKTHGGNSTPYYSMATKPSFGQWLRYTWLDILTMVIMGVIGLGVCEPDAPGRTPPRSQLTSLLRSTKPTLPRRGPFP